MPLFSHMQNVGFLMISAKKNYQEITVLMTESGVVPDGLLKGQGQNIVSKELYLTLS